MHRSRSARHGVLVLAFALAACGGAQEEKATATPQDTLIRPMVREPLTEADLAGLTPAELALELPWTTNTVTRSAVPGASAASIGGGEITPLDTFDRVTFLVDDTQPIPGYDIAFSAAGTSIACGERTYRTSAERSLVVTFRPARAAAEGEAALPQGVRSTRASRMGRAGVACDAGDALVWVAELSRGDQVRILELRGPGRIAVDVR